MCGVDVDLDEGGSGDEEKEQEFWVGEGVKMLPPPLAHSEGSAWGSRRGRCGCVACGRAAVVERGRGPGVCPGPDGRVHPGPAARLAAALRRLPLPLTGE
ncbi:unnamed protein product [Oncorhynchus mykiss]|uniref:Uncharacterized protein n=1 Tax=Oncorhynchus mykiss TaxID=8022 RepID=A0A060ZAJ8_ONCMY|nr:unnamed protein product [Oncorhynchus mykiss]